MAQASASALSSRPPGVQAQAPHSTLSGDAVAETAAPSPPESNIKSHSFLQVIFSMMYLESPMKRSDSIDKQFLSLSTETWLQEDRREGRKKTE